MGKKRRTAVLLGLLVVLVLASGAIWLLVSLRPENLRRIVRDQIQAGLSPGFDAELDRAEWSFDAGLRAEGLRVRHRATREVLLSAPRVRADARVHELVRHGRVTDVEIADPDVVLVRGGDGAYPLLEAFRDPEDPETEEPVRLPRVRIKGGRVRWSDPDVLAAGEAVLLRIVSLELQERKGRRPSVLEAELVEEGGSGGGSLGRVSVRGLVPPTGKEGLSVSIREFEVGDALRARLAPAVLAHAGAIAAEGTFGAPEGPAGLEVTLRVPEGGGAPAFAAVLRPRDVAVLARDFPVLFRSVSGELRWEDGVLDIPGLSLRRDGAAFAVRGRLALADPARPSGRVEFRARDLYLDRGLRDALPEAARRVWDAYDLDGTVDVTQAPRGEEPSFDSYVAFGGAWTPTDLKVAVSLRDGGIAYKGYLDRQGVRHGFDFRLTEVTGSLVVETRGSEVTIFLDGLHGRRGPVGVTASGRIREFGGGRAEVLVNIHARDVPLDDEIRRAFTDPADFDRWSPTGIASLVHVRVDQHPELDRGAFESVFVHLDGRASFSYSGFPLRLHGVSGVVEQVRDRVEGRLVPRTTFRGLEATVGEGRLAVDGTVEGTGDAARLAVSVRGSGIALDEAVEKALADAPSGAKALAAWRSLRPGGRADVRAEISGTVGKPREQFRFDLRGASAGGWGPVTVALTGLEGVVEIAPEAVALRGIRGEGPDGPVRIDGEIRDPGGEATLDLALEAGSLRLDDSLRAILGSAGDGFAAYWDVVRPAPGLAADARVLLRGPASKPDVEVALDGLRGGLAPFGLRNLDLGEGSVRYRDGRLALTGIAGAMADRELLLREATLDLAAGEGTLAVEVRRLRFPRDLEGLLPESVTAEVERLAPDRFFHVPDLRVVLSRNWRRIALDGTLSLSPRREGVSPGLGLEGVFALEGLTFDLPAAGTEGAVGMGGAVLVSRGVVSPGIRIESLAGRLDLTGAAGGEGAELRVRMTDLSGRVEGRALRGATADLSWSDGVFRMSQLRGTLAGGSFGGSFEAGERKPAWEGRFSLVGADARELFVPAEPRSRLAGTVSGNLWIFSPTGAVGRVGGEGALEVVEGRLFEIPIISGIFSLPILNIAAGADPGLITRAGARWRHAGDKIVFDEIHLDSAVAGLRKATGRSQAWLDGRLDIGLTPDFRMGTVGDVLFVVSAIWDRLQKIHVGGTVRNPEVTLSILPGLVTRDGGAVRFEPPEPFLALPSAPPWEF